MTPIRKNRQTQDGMRSLWSESLSAVTLFNYDVILTLGARSRALTGKTLHDGHPQHPMQRTIVWPHHSSSKSTTIALVCHQQLIPYTLLSHVISCMEWGALPIPIRKNMSAAETKLLRKWLLLWVFRKILHRNYRPNGRILE